MAVQHTTPADELFDRARGTLASGVSASMRLHPYLGRPFYHVRGEGPYLFDIDGAGQWTVFRRVTLPAIRWAVIYGVILTTARSIGEFGAVAVVSGNVLGQTETMPLYVKRVYEGFDKQGAYSASVVLALIALSTVLLMTMFKPRQEA